MTPEPAKLRQTAEFKHETPLTCGAIDPTGRFVLAGGRDRSLVCLDIAAGAKSSLDAHESWISAAVRAPQDLVFTADFAGRLVAWDCTNDRPTVRWNIAAHDRTIYSLAVSRDGTVVATGDREGTIRVWRAKDGERQTELAGLAYPVYGLAFHPDGQRLVSADRQPRRPRLQWWDWATGKSLRTVDVPQLSAYRRVEDIEWGGIRALSISPNGRWIAAVGENEYAGPACALLLDFDSGEIARKWISPLKGFCYAALFHSDSLLLTAAGDIGKGELRAWTIDAMDPASPGSSADKDGPANEGEKPAADKPAAAKPSADKPASNGPMASTESWASLATTGPCMAVALAPDSTRCALMQMTGKGSYPDAGLLTIVEW